MKEENANSIRNRWTNLPPLENDSILGFDARVLLDGSHAPEHVLGLGQPFGVEIHGMNNARTEEPPCCRSAQRDQEKEYATWTNKLPHHFAL